MIIVLAVISILYGALLAIGQSDLKRLIAYTSISHFGFIVLGIFAMTVDGPVPARRSTWSTTASRRRRCSCSPGMLIARRGSQQIADFGGLQRVDPAARRDVPASPACRALSLPGLSSFISEFLVLVGTFARYPAAAVVATLGIVLAALYILLTYQRMFTGPVRESLRGWPDMHAPRGVGHRAADRA